MLCIKEHIPELGYSMEKLAHTNTLIHTLTHLSHALHTLWVILTDFGPILKWLVPISSYLS